MMLWGFFAIVLEWNFFMDRIACTQFADVTFDHVACDLCDCALGAHCDLCKNGWTNPDARLVCLGKPVLDGGVQIILWTGALVRVTCARSL